MRLRTPAPAASGHGGLAAVPYWRLSTFYLFYFATVGALLPFWGLYLKHLGFSAAEIGELMAILVGTKIIAPNVWGWIADHRGQRMAIVRGTSLLACLIFLGVFLTQSYWPLALVMLVFSFFWNASLPQFEATTLTHLGERAHGYTRIRVWGSIGFIFAVAGLGYLLEYRGVEALPLVVLLLMGGIWLASLSVPEQAAGHRHLSQVPLRQVLRRPAVLALLAVCFLMQAGHGPYYGFYSIYLAERGYGAGLIGQLWGLGVLAEVGVFLVMHRIVLRVGLRALLLGSLALAVLRWFLIAWFVDSLGILVAAQLLHAATFGIYHAAAIQLIHRHFVGRHQGRGQALYSSLSFGAGGALGALAGGYLWESAGPVASYTGAAAVSLLGLLIAWRWIHDR